MHKLKYHSQTEMQLSLFNSTVHCRDLQSNILSEDTKRNLLTYHSNLSNSFCIHCLQPFKFLLKSKCQCRNCKVFICKACSCFNKKEHGWLCDPCYMVKVLRIGKLEWFHENVYARFKQSGSAKVMMSLYKRLHGGQSCSQPDLRVGSSFSQGDRHSNGSGRQHCKLAETLDPEELELKQKLKKLTENISDKEKCSEENCTSDEDEANQLRDDIKPPGTKEPYFASALRSKTMTSDDFFGSFFRNELSSLQRSAVDLERPTVTQRRLSFYEVSTASCELSRLEDEVATAVARVQRAQSEVTAIQKRIAALGQE
ncbi:melanophilin isoform X1 [Ictalurus punctatus]|uniref:Melanophilin isoform X1 n=1 Tax=Ictalurus punctatus TaxID=7998 RepID=A0A9F7TL57_ICTPU|nr:melanophilin isoform X1 [Ictalurus punctatus]